MEQIDGMDSKFFFRGTNKSYLSYSSVIIQFILWKVLYLLKPPNYLFFTTFINVVSGQALVHT